jgi:hypothetical protein
MHRRLKEHAEENKIAATRAKMIMLYTVELPPQAAFRGLYI